MYMLRAYQSPASMPDCGPQCAQMPNFASRNHRGTSYRCSDSRVPWNGPAWMPKSNDCCARNAAEAPASAPMAVRRVMSISHTLSVADEGCLPLMNRDRLHQTVDG